MAKNSKNNAKATEEKAVVTEVKDSNIVDSVEALEAKLAQVREAQKKFSTYTQEQVDKIFKAAAIAANQARIPLAKQAVEETGMGVVEDKVTELVNAIQDTNEYKRYQEAKNKLHANPELEQIVFAFRQKNYQIQNSKNVDLFWEVDQLERENIDIRKNPVAEEFMTAELAFCRLLQKINFRLVGGLNFEVGFVNER